MAATSTGRYQVHFLKKSYSLSDGVHLVHEIKQRFLKALSAKSERLPQCVLKESYGNILFEEGDESGNCAALRKSSRENEPDLADPAGLSQQRESKTTAISPARNSRRKVVY